MYGIEEDEAGMDSDSSCYCEEPFYFAKEPSSRPRRSMVWSVTPRYRFCSWRLSAHVLVERGVSSGVRYWRAFANRGGLVSSAGSQ